MDYEAEKMTTAVMERLLNCAYNDVTFKNALVCALDWCNQQRCANIHKDTRIAVDSNGERIDKYAQVDFHDKYVLTEDTTVDVSKKYFTYDETKDKYYRVYGGSAINPQEEGWYEYINPSDIHHQWYEKLKNLTEYSQVSKDKISYWDSPSVNKWYKNTGTEEHPVYELSTETHCRGSYTALVDPASNSNPRDNDWYEKTGSADPDVPDNYTPSNDIVVVTGKTYYSCSYYQYFMQISRSTKAYVHTADTIIQDDKAYYTETADGEIHWLPENPEEWDYTNHYERHVDISIKGIENEVTLQNKRPVTT